MPPFSIDLQQCSKDNDADFEVAERITGNFVITCLGQKETTGYKVLVEMKAASFHI